MFRSRFLPLLLTLTALLLAACGDKPKASAKPAASEKAEAVATKEAEADTKAEGDQTESNASKSKDKASAKNESLAASRSRAPSSGMSRSRAAPTIAKKLTDEELKQAIESYNLVFGTQTIKPHYQFTSDSKLVETAKGILEMGSNILKINLSPDSYDLTESAHYEYKYVPLLREEKNFREVMDMPFTYYFLWLERAGAFLDGDGLTESEFQTEYEETYALAEYLLSTYSGTGKQFFLGNWEGDWHLVNDNNDWNYGRPVVPEDRLQGMTAWLRARQKAVDDAKAQVPHENVSIYHYVEVNLVETSLKTFDRITNKILPEVDVDLVSYSCYDMTCRFEEFEPMRESLFKAMDHIESNLRPKAGLPFKKRVYLGEFGFPVGRNDPNRNDPKTAEEQDRRSRMLMRAALEWGSPFNLYWQFYDNEHTNSGYNGFWMIDDKQQQWPIYKTYAGYLKGMKAWLWTYYKDRGSFPTDTEFRNKAISMLTF